MEAFLFWLVVCWGIKKMDDHRRSYISQEDYRRLQREANERDGKPPSLPPPRIE